MNIDPKAYAIALQSYNLKKQNFEKEIQSKIQKLKMVSPEFNQIEIEQNSLGTQIASSVISGNTIEIINKLRPLADELMFRKNQILKSHDIPTTDNIMDSFCSICSGKGVTSNGLCSCFSKEYKSAQYHLNSDAFAFSDGMIRNFSLSDYSGQVNIKTGKSDKEIIEKLINRFDSYGSLPYENILLTNPCCIAKKFLESFSLKKAIDNGFFSIYLSAFSLSKMIEDDRYNRFKNDNDFHLNEDILRLKNCDLLIIDGMGSEPVSTYYIGYLLDIIDHRLAEKKVTICSLSIPRSDMGTYYNSELVFRFSRFVNYNVPLTVNEI